MYIKKNDILKSHSSHLLDGSSGAPLSNNISSHNKNVVDSCNLASFIEYNADREERQQRWFSVAEDIECVTLTKAGADVALIFRASDIKRYLIHLGSSGGLTAYSSTVAPFYMENHAMVAHHQDPSFVLKEILGGAGLLYAYFNADGVVNPADWYSETEATEDYIAFPLVEYAITTYATYNLGYLVTDVSETDAVYNLKDVVKLNEF